MYTCQRGEPLSALEGRPPDHKLTCFVNVFFALQDRLGTFNECISSPQDANDEPRGSSREQSELPGKSVRLVSLGGHVVAAPGCPSGDVAAHGFGSRRVQTDRPP